MKEESAWKLPAEGLSQTARNEIKTILMDFLKADGKVLEYPNKPDWDAAGNPKLGEFMAEQTKPIIYIYKGGAMPTLAHELFHYLQWKATIAAGEVWQKFIRNPEIEQGFEDVVQEQLRKWGFVKKP